MRIVVLIRNFFEEEKGSSFQAIQEHFCFITLSLVVVIDMCSKIMYVDDKVGRKDVYAACG